LGRHIRRDTALAGMTLPLHIGARQYYQRAGLRLP
jgi:TRAP-type uncharacterized transport system substrate-binding protein